MATHQLRTYEPFADFFRGGPLLDLMPMFDLPRVRPALATMPSAPTIRMDVKETPEAYFVTAGIPGVRKEDIHVTVDGGTVGIMATVERRNEKKDGETVLCTELYTGEVAHVHAAGRRRRSQGRGEVRGRHAGAQTAEAGGGPGDDIDGRLTLPVAGGAAWQ
jgi:HSP20 family protein